jgi:hypothetical protein
MDDLQNKHPFIRLMEKKLDGNNFTKTMICSVTYEPLLCVHDINVIESLYTTHNANFDKHPIV